ncbi:MAG: hypothetical protein LUC93_11300 [Planctomycetaceae bacterium]|nr:hypothetical protein [Planctomycetaceae bacterium]
MKLLWGDLHNHCGITYGTGSLEDALRLARVQLDFCSVTPHAFWPDMPERTDDTAFIVDFHTQGFAKIAAGWQDYVDAIDAANRPGEFSTFFSFEMHSSRWGDHTFVSPDRRCRIERMTTPREVVEAIHPIPLVAIPHHIGYTPGYRGIAWDGFDESISPAVEVVSKHGCAMHEFTGGPYYHDMGPLDPRTSVYAGLNAGRRFSFLGSTDHHAGCPGSYGDGKMAVLAQGNTRDDIWQAVLAGRTYAVSGCKIDCRFSVNDAVFGSRIAHGPAHIAYAVEAGGAIDKVVVYRDLEPLEIVDGLRLPPTGSRFKVKLEFGWGDNDEPFRWDIEAAVTGGRLVGVEPCFRGRSMLSPTQRLANTDSVNALTMELESDETRTRLACDTFKNVSTLHPSTSAVIVEIEGDDATRLACRFNGQAVEADVGELRRFGRSGPLKAHNSNASLLPPAVPSGQYRVHGEVDDAGGGFYHMEVTQRDGDRAFVSPVFMHRGQQ